MSKTRDTGNITNVIKVDATGNVSFVSGSTTLATISTSGQMSGSLPALSSSYALSASYVTNAETLDGLDSTVFTLTSSFNTTSASLYTVSSSAYATSGSLSATSGSLSATSGSLSATSGSLSAASGSLSATSGSLNTRVTALEVTGSALSSSILSVSASSYLTSGSLSSASGSFDTRISTVESKYATTGSNTFIGTQIISGSILQSGSFTSTGTLTAQTLVVQTITSSVVYSSGSNIFGNSLGNSQVFTGSVLITGSLSLNSIAIPTSASLASTYLPLAGGTLTGQTLVSYAMGGDNGFVIQHSNLTQGISIGYSTIKTSGTSANQNLTFYSQGTGVINLVSDTQVNGIFTALSTITGTTIYGSTAVCSPVGLFSGCIGIGTSSPTEKLVVVGNIYTNGTNTNLYLDNGGAGGASLKIGVIGTTETYINSLDNDPLWFGTSNTERMRITSTGVACFACQVCAPSAVFSKAADQVIRVETTSATDNSRIDFITPSKCYTIQNLQTGAANALIFYDLSASAERMRITNCGNVGIGINPTSTFFQVSGNSPDNIAWFNNTQSNGYASARFYNNCNKAAVFGVGGSAVGAPYANNGYIYTDSGVDLAFAMGGVERMRITSTGIATFTCTVCSTNFQTGANSNLSKSSIRLRSANDNKYLDFNSFNTCNVINSNYGDSDIPLILGTYFGHQTNQLFLATNCNVGIGTNSPNERLDVNGTIQVRGESIGYATTQCVTQLDFYAGAARLLSFGGNSTTCGGFRFYSAGQNNNGGSDVATISGGGAACFASTIQATGATIASDVVGDPVYLRVRNNNTGGYPSSLALSLYGYSSPAAYFDALRIQASYPGYGSANFFVKYQSNSADVLVLTLRGDGWIISPTTYNNTSGVAANLGIDSSGNIFRATSSSKYKKDIKSYDKGLDTVLLMNPIYYKSKSEFDGGKQFAGFIAEEIDTLGLNEFVQYNDETNEPEGLNYGNITAILTKAIQELKAQNDTLKEILQRNNIQ